MHFVTNKLLSHMTTQPRKPTEKLSRKFVVNWHGKFVFSFKETNCTGVL